MDDMIRRKDAIDSILGITNCNTVDELRAYVIEHDLGSWWSGGVLSSIDSVRRLPSAEPEIKPISYHDCANAMMKMWMDNVLTDGEYNRIMDKLNDHERAERRMDE